MMSALFTALMIVFCAAELVYYCWLLISFTGRLFLKVLGLRSSIFTPIRKYKEEVPNDVSTTQNIQERDTELIEFITNIKDSNDEITCINCNYIHPENSTELCPNCGLSNYVKVDYQSCTNCGSEYSSDSVECSICGYSRDRVIQKY